MTIWSHPQRGRWAGGGTLVTRSLTRPAMLRGFDVGMAMLLVASLLPGLLELVDNA